MMTNISVLGVLRAEYALLCMANFFKAELTNLRRIVGWLQYPVRDHWQSCFSLISLSEFYFNFEKSIIGTLTEDSAGFLLHHHFIATPLLPCGTMDAPVKKFTGNGLLGDATDHITSTTHAFAHFSVLYSSNNIVFCDLQGSVLY
jgi:hypothetical protein